MRVNYDILIKFFGVKHPFKYSEMIIFFVWQHEVEPEVCLRSAGASEVS